MISVIDLTLKLMRLPLRLYFYLQYNSYRKKFDIDDSFQFLGRWIELYGEGKIQFLGGSYCGHNCSFQSIKGCKISVGTNTAISHNVRIYTMNRKSSSIICLESEMRPVYKKGDVSIGNNCWIGSNVFITEGVKIGDNVVVGANSVVTRDLMNNSVYAGVPARLIKTNNDI